MDKALAQLPLRVPINLKKELNQEADNAKQVLSDYVRGILSRRNQISQPIPGQSELEEKLKQVEQRLAKANKELDSMGFKTY